MGYFCLPTRYDKSGVAAPSTALTMFSLTHGPRIWVMQDIVARRGKLWILYKRSGHRVIINTRGDLIVRPSFAEANVQRIPGGRLPARPSPHSTRLNLLPKAPAGRMCKNQIVLLCNSSRAWNGWAGAQDLLLVAHSEGALRSPCGQHDHTL